MPEDEAERPGKPCIFKNPSQETTSGASYHQCRLKKVIGRENTACSFALYTNDYGREFVEAPLSRQQSCPCYVPFGEPTTAEALERCMRQVLRGL